MAEITVDPNISSYNADKKRYGPIQEARRGDLEKSRLFGGKKRGQDQTLGARGRPAQPPITGLHNTAAVERHHCSKLR